MSKLSTLKENWRVVLLSVLLIGSAFALFSPSAGADGGSGSALATNLQYGIELDGGSRIRAPIVGLTATGLDVPQDPQERAEIERTVSNELGLDPIDVTVSAGERTRDGSSSVEVFPETQEAVSASAFVDALTVAGLDATVEDVSPGVTAQTRSEMVTAIQSKISESAFSGGNAWQVERGSDQFIVVETPSSSVSNLTRLLSERGSVEIEAYYPTGNGTHANQTVLRGDDFTNVGPAEYEAPPNGPGHHVDVAIRESVAGEFAATMVDLGYDSETQCGAGASGFQGYGNYGPNDRCLLVVSNGEVVNAFGVEGGLARTFTGGENSDFAQNPQFVLTVTSQAEAEQVSLDLRASRLPASLDMDAGTKFSIEPALAKRFKLNAFITGLIAVLAVSLVVYLRYGDRRIAFPMVFTALSEVIILLGFAAAVRYPLDIPAIAGFIAVIGTGVDDLVIIADEVMAEKVSSNRVFRNRFRKAFWTIGAAAATTIVAMAPLATPWLSLGDLQSFAIITILGVLIGVLITRPAYGDVLRQFVTDH